MRLFHLNQSTEQPWHEIYIFLYVIFTLASFSANSLLLLALYSHNLKRNRISNSAPSRNARSSEKTRDILVAHLAVFDLLLSITMPFTAMDALSKYWPLGSDTEMICRLIKSIPSAAVYSSSMVIVTIAINCCRMVLFPSNSQLSPSSLKYITPSIVFTAVFMSSPIFYYSKLYFIVEPTPFNDSSPVLTLLNSTKILDNETHILAIPSDSFDDESYISGISINTSNNFLSPLNYSGNYVDISEFNFSDVYVDSVEKDSAKCNEDEVFTDDDWMKVLFFIDIRSQITF